MVVVHGTQRQNVVRPLRLTLGFVYFFITLILYMEHRLASRKSISFAFLLALILVIQFQFFKGPELAYLIKDMISPADGLRPYKSPYEDKKNLTMQPLPIKDCYINGRSTRKLKTAPQISADRGKVEALRGQILCFLGCHP